MSEREFCKTLDRVQHSEKREFVEAVKKGDTDRASRILESISFTSEVLDGVCFIGPPERKRRDRR